MEENKIIFNNQTKKATIFFTEKNDSVGIPSPRGNKQITMLILFWYKYLRGRPWGVLPQLLENLKKCWGKNGWGFNWLEIKRLTTRRYSAAREFNSIKNAADRKTDR